MRDSVGKRKARNLFVLPGRRRWRGRGVGDGRVVRRG
jgi:hypothetical protein